MEKEEMKSLSEEELQARISRALSSMKDADPEELERVKGIIKKNVPFFVSRWVYRLLWKEVEHVNQIGKRFPYFMPFEDVFEQARQASRVITLNAQFGEGWLLPGEIVSYASQGVKNVVSLQPFGCIANHIVAKGMEKRITRLFPDLNLLSLDFDSGVSEVNVTNRLLLFTNNLKN